MYFVLNNQPALYYSITRTENHQRTTCSFYTFRGSESRGDRREGIKEKIFCSFIASSPWFGLIMDIFQRYYQSINLLLTFFTLKTAADEDILFCKITNTQFCPSPGEYNASKVLQYSILILCIFCHILPSFCPNNGH